MLCYPLSDDSYECQLFAPSAGRFLNAIFEEYATLPQHEREAIALTDRMNLLQYAIDTQSMLKLTVQDDASQANDTYIVQPYVILADSTKRYNYLTTYSRPNGMDTGFYMASYRIANIKELKLTREKFVLTKVLINALKRGIQEKGVPFLVGDLETYDIVFSDEGLNLFRNILNLRPTILAFNKNRFTLRSTKYQKEIYFKQFTSDMYEELIL